MTNVALFSALAFIISVTRTRSTSLLPGGTNVMKKYEQYQSRQATTTRITKYRRTCTQSCWAWVICNTKCSTKAFPAYVPAYKMVTKTRLIYVCKTGWKQAGNECTIPICPGGCQNNGVCTSPNVCNCPAQWKGANCQQDVNECDAKSGISHGCQYKCVNFPGGYNCTCADGHFLASNGRNCTDHDECAGNIHHCEQRCLNFPGGYSCSCRPGYTLNANDNKTCDGHLCEKVRGPVHGSMQCSGNTTDHVCTFDCDPGYELLGSNKRSCSATGRWTGDETICKIIHCPQAPSPQHGFVYAPCDTPFGSKCIVGCRRGYFMEGSTMISCNSSGAWQPDNLSCTKSTACERSPCEHNGVCIPMSISRYVCDCSNTGYRGINCHIGYITVPKYPRVTTGIPSSPLEFRSSPLSSGHVILTPSSRDVVFIPSFLVFNSTSAPQSLMLTSKRAGIKLIKYSISGPNAVEFTPPVNDVIFVDVIKNSTNRKIRNSTTMKLKLPIGCNEVVLEKCPAGNDVILSSSTTPWETTGLVTSSSGVIVVHAGKLDFPMSLLGASLPRKTQSLDEKCSRNQNYSVEELAGNQILTKTFLDSLKASFPNWLRVTLRRDIRTKEVHLSDISTQFLSGKELPHHIVRGQPVSHDSAFLLLQSSNMNVTLENDGDVFKARDGNTRTSLAVDLCSGSPQTVILRAPEKHLIQNSSVFKRLKRDGWEMTVYSFQISKTNSIHTPFGKQRFWNGEKLILTGGLKRKSNLALVTKLKKSFARQNVSSVLEFDGTMVIAVEDLYKVLQFPLDQIWLVDLHGNIKLTIQFAVEGKMTNMTLKAAESISFATFGESRKENKQVSQKGLYISHPLETNPFINSDLARFVEISPGDGIEAFIETNLRSKPANNKTSSSDQIESVNLAFRGVLKFGPLRFEDFGIVLKKKDKLDSQDDDIIVKGKASIDMAQNYGVFKPKNLNVDLRISSQNGRMSRGSFESNVELLGLKDFVNVSFARSGLKFNATGKVHGVFEADLSCVSSLESWKDQRFVVSGQFKSDASSLVDELGYILYDYAFKVHEKAVKRVAFFEKRSLRAKSRLDSGLAVLEGKQEELNKSLAAYNDSIRNLRVAESRLKSLQGNVSRRLDDLKALLDTFCPEAKQCPEICQAGVVCQNCNYEIAGKSKKNCLATCHKTETLLVQTNASYAPCKRQKCVRVYMKDGLVMDTLQESLFDVQKDIFSFGKKFSNYLTVGGNSELFPGTRKRDVCKYSDNINSQVSEKLCESDDRNGHWDCNIHTEMCAASGHRYEKYRAPYTCQRPCETHVTTENITKSCCATVPCAFKTIDRTCIAKNVFCNKIRIDALQKLTANESNFEIRDILKQVEVARGDMFYWQVKSRTDEIRLKSARNLLILAQDTATRLQKAYDISLMSRRNMSSSLVEKLNLKWIFDENRRGIVIQRASFEVEVQKGGNFLIPVKFILRVNDTRREFKAIIDFREVNASLSGVAKDILNLYGKVGVESFRSERRRRSIDSDYALSNLKKYNAMCSQFTNFEQALEDMSRSLFNLTTEAKKFIKDSSERNVSLSSFNASDIFDNFNTSLAALFKLKIDRESYLNHLKDDEIMSAAHELHQEALDDGYKPLYLNSKVLFKNWFSAMENIFDVVLSNCSGFEDCIVYITDSLFEMNEASGLRGSHKLRELIAYLRKELGRLSMNTEIPLNEANEVSLNILNALNDMRAVKLFCAQAPNITKQPDTFTDVGEGRPLIMTCNASGDFLKFNWMYGDDYLTDQTSETLFITESKSTHSGNYTCVVTNHVSMEMSSPVLVIVHPAPSITVQPIKRLNAIVRTNDSLRCSGETTDKNMTYQWYFRAKNSSVFIKLRGQEFSYLNFLPVESRHEGWYYCNVSNYYGATRSRTSFMKVLDFSMPASEIKLAVNLAQSRKNVRARRSEPNGVSYEEIRSQLSLLLSLTARKVPSVRDNTTTTFPNGTSTAIKNDTTSSGNGTTNSSAPFNPQVRDLKITKCRTITTSKVCQWVFSFVGERSSSGNGENFVQDSRNVIGSLRELRAAIGRLVEAVNSGALYFDIGDQRFSVEKNSVGVEDVTMACPRGRRMLNDFRCVDCLPGYYGIMDENTIATCVPCVEGTYQPNSGQRECVQCPEGFTTVEKGAIDLSQCKVICPAGTYGQITDNVGRCLDCPGNTYQPMRGQFECLPCPDGQVTAAKGAKNISQCYPEPATTKRPTEHVQRTTQEEREATKTETERKTTDDGGEPGKLGARSDTNEENKAAAIGGSLGGFFVLGVLVIFFFVQRNRTAKKSDELADDKNIVTSDGEMELNAWSNPIFNEDVCSNETGYNEDSYVISPTPGRSEKNPNDFSDAAVLQVRVDYQNSSACRNPLYESNPARDLVNEGTQGGEYCEPVVLSGEGLTKYANPLYEELEREKAQKSSTLNLNDDVIVDEDV